MESVENTDAKIRNESLEDVALESLSVLIAVRDKIPYETRLKKVVSRLRRALDGKTK